MDNYSNVFPMWKEVMIAIAVGMIAGLVAVIILIPID